MVNPYAKYPNYMERSPPLEHKNYYGQCAPLEEKTPPTPHINKYEPQATQVSFKPIDIKV